MSDLRTNVDQLNQMILEGKILDAFDKFYAEEVVMQDNNYPAREGKALNRQYEEAFVGGLTEFRGAKVVNTLISDDLAVTEWWFDYTHKDYGVRNYTQLAVQRWKNGQIVEEKFYYNN
ncbi:MAG TPA: nuclear transport factor 2 family protein [Chitinophagaceae bacterium]|jgi:SnoaL-like domain|nr:nuclear transport factor 2 family protein [Chitinophagaceae bacterium]